MKNMRYKGSKDKLVKTDRFVAHLILISILFVLPEVIMNYAMSSSSRPQPLGSQVHMYMKSFIYICVFYVEYYFIIGHSLAPKVKIWRFIAYNVLLLALALLISQWTWHYLVELPRQTAHISRHAIPNHRTVPYLKPISFMLRDGVMVVLTMAFAVALRLSDFWSALQRRREDLEAAQRMSELASLKSQLNPHFLFNTLNTIYALIQLAPDTAQQAVHELSGMLRYMLYNTNSEVALKEETEFSKNFISLMTLRLPDGVIQSDFDISSMEDAKIAPLLFITLIENAFKHGVSGDKDDVVKIEISAHNGVVTCSTLNRFTHSSASNTGGVGLNNLRRRLQLIYGKNASLSVSVKDSCYSAVLKINLQTPTVES